MSKNFIKHIFNDSTSLNGCHDENHTHKIYAFFTRGLFQVLVTKKKNKCFVCDKTPYVTLNE